jgi:hypothetical protein
MLIKLLRKAGEIGIVDKRHDPGSQVIHPHVEGRVDRLDGCAGEQADREKAEYDPRRDIENGAAKHESILPQSRNVFSLILKRPKSM